MKPWDRQSMMYLAEQLQRKLSWIYANDGRVYKREECAIIRKRLQNVRNILKR